MYSIYSKFISLNFIEINTEQAKIRNQIKQKQICRNGLIETFEQLIRFYPYCSNVTPPISEPFAGDLKNIKLSNSKTNTLDSRYFNAPQTVNYNGGTYIGVIRGKVKCPRHF